MTTLTEPTSTEPGAPTPRQADALRRLALQRYRIGCEPDGSAFAVPLDGPYVVRALRGGRTSLRAELAATYAARNEGRVPTAQALADALLALEGDAARATPEPLALRVAEHDCSLVVDLGTPSGQAVRITADGWTLEKTSPVLFRRTALTGELPEPTTAGDLGPLWRRLNIAAADRPLILGWLIAGLMPGIPHPVLSLIGEQGTGKSTAAKLLVSTVDPSPAPLRTAPRDVESWAVAAQGSWLVALDNLSGVQPWLSDVLCRAVTGDGIVRRKLYTDSELSVLSFRRVVLLNGIDLGTLRGDLADRLLAIELETIDATRRQTAGAVEMDAIEQAQVLGALLDLAAKVLRVLPDVKLDELPRMADFARILAALDIINPEGNGEALRRYLNQAASLAETVTDADPFATAVRSLADQRREWTGSPLELLAVLDPDSRAKQWPTTGQAASAALRRIAPALRQIGYGIAQIGRQPKTGKRLWAITSRGDELIGETNNVTPIVTPNVTPSEAYLTWGIGGQPSWGDKGDDPAGHSSQLALDVLNAQVTVEPVHA